MKKRILGLLVAATMPGALSGAWAQPGPGDKPVGAGPDHVHKTQADRASDRDGATPPLPDARMNPARGDWHRRGGRVPQDYRGRKYVVDDWRRHHLQPPPSGYPWLQIDGDFVLVAITTGVITSILSGPHH
ncbi:RcnB family protein [Burkholderia multivorans]|uniref:RcnB family protein n=1 Tax=Burkholderia multivorans TaxID=87883 RepID=UPI0020189E0B|nr:RcnB family protein [Burkholderia multivorans]MCA8143492.1 RcnB family protein [Burkholderia multivorans]MCO1368502.1 RcnB family protein [Burkholderia multivorans]MCO1380393.1 RcnB family protein [Burkholderia multivorans]MDN8032836.1 RcnB family protein [Burkholderia multivorans]UQP21496.1 RcnB family protein [Burkholderia multivorans]